MKIAIDKNGDGVIDNIVEAESLEAAAALFPEDTVLDAVESGVQIGWIAAGGGADTPRPPLLNRSQKTSTRWGSGCSFSKSRACRMLTCLPRTTTRICGSCGKT